MTAWRPWPRGLRSRLLLAFALTTVLGAAAASAASAASASASLVDAAQQRLTRTVTAQIGALAPQLTYPPDQAALDRLRSAVGPGTLVTYGTLRSDDGSVTRLATEALRTEVRLRHQLFTQRLTVDAAPWLVIGTPVMITATDGTRTPSGIEVYSAHDLTSVQQQTDALTRAAALAAAATIPLSILLALIVAGGVLRPVRKLRDTARRLARGDLSARSAPKGADELAELTVTVNEMAESVQTSMTAMEQMRNDAKRFAADVSHELRTPLSTLTAVVEVLATTADGMEPDARESARLAITETHRLVHLVEDLMEISRFDAGTAQLRLEEVEVAEAVRHCLRARSWLDEVELAAPAEIRLRADRRRLDVIVANLVGNALRHGAKPVRVQVSASPSTVRIEVTDHGPGLSEDVLPHVFDRFYKADTARTRTPGSGLGLAITRENARAHGGELRAGNTPGGGARFVLELPRNQEDE
ncbi:sensor histidine kinase [Amycolatopsis benzoatilytica]|uniref:sensor histidine kinase n=1 Tax=Amycolatopsis benzoatilytica TaxID=346045 RepID=UPI00036DD288|nr:HAMP domain-containing sensor histidine kinase [Amycolatopsis benzoatilytica]